MSVISDEYIKHVIVNIVTALKLKEWSYSIRNFKNIAQNYFGVLIPIYITAKEIDNKHVNIPLVLKLAPTDERYRVSGAVTIFFAKEIFVYSKVLHKYREIQNSFLMSSRFIMPLCYYVCNDYCKELLAIQNMCEDNYKPFVSSMFLDIDHITEALKSLARFHAMSYILKETNSALYEEAKEFCVPLTEKNNKRFMDILIDRLKKALIKFENTHYTTLLQTLQIKCASIIESAAESVKSLCLCHGDIWKENILFKYKDNFPISACIIDYQTTRMSSPAFDILYLIITSTTSYLRKKHFNYLLDTYYQTFKQTLEHGSLDSNKIYSRDMLDYDLKIVSPSCLIVANTAIWLASGLQEVGHVKSKIVLNTEAEKLYAETHYKDIISGIVDDLLNYNFLSTIVE